MTAACLIASIAFFVASIIYLADWLLDRRVSSWLLVSNALFLLLVISFAYGNILYQMARIGYFRRRGRLEMVEHADAPLRYARTVSQAPTLTVLIPAYKEEIETIRQTLVSATLMGYRSKTVCVLLDDPLTDVGTQDYEMTRKTKAMINGHNKSLRRLYAIWAKKSDQGVERLHNGVSVYDEALHLAEHYGQIADWFRDTGASYPTDSHVDRHFVSLVFTSPAKTYRKIAKHIATSAHNATKTELITEYRYLRDMFDVSVTFMQRKAFSNLSHEPNKAMNINSYLSLMGDDYGVVADGVSQSLTPIDDATEAYISIPDADYVVTLDADSIVDHSYASTLIDIMEQPENRRIAVAQTPYNAFHGSSSILERTAGATTDIQHIIHQGFTAYGATYWVGANALLRKIALDEIAEPIKGETLVKQYIQDRTVIEDTESSIDLVGKSWQLYNHPQKLAFSATPADYGSLLIQRRRWANGGLIILPKLLRYLCKKPSLRKIAEGFMRIHYLVSIALVNLSLVIMLFIPLGDVGFSYWVPLTALPYYLLYARDLKLSGYGVRDLFRVYALNLLLIPINIGGVLKSLQQMITKQKIPFGRTPKIGDRTAAPLLYYSMTYGLFGYLVYLSVVSFADEQFFAAIFIAINTLFIGYAITVFVGISSAWEDFYRTLSPWASRIVMRARNTVLRFENE